MDAIVLDRIPFKVNMSQLTSQLKIEEGTNDHCELTELVKEAEMLAKPKAAYLEAFVLEKGEDFVNIEGIILKSRVLRVNLEQAHRVFPHLATSGTELEAWSESISDFIVRFWADAIKQMALVQARKYLIDHIQEYKKPGKISAMNPGSLADWPIREQKSLFSLMGDCSRQIGVRLTDGFLMTPVKSVSGIFFPAEVTFESCQLCPRHECPGRRASYEPELLNGKYKL